MLRQSAKTLPSNPFSALLRELKPEIDQQVAAVLDGELVRYRKSGVEVEAMLEATRELSLRGGKRLRAALVLAGQKAVERRSSPWRRAIRVGTAVELLQSYFLIHDDWMDQDATRRGGPSVHAALSRRFRSAHAGACSAVLAGDYLAAVATRTLLDATRGHKQQSALLHAFVEMQTAAVVGQQLDAVQLSRNAERVYEFKTASYTVSGPLRLGALLAGADRATLKSLDSFARPLGIAFQLRDDLLSLYASPKKTGKPLASDLREGKWTWIVQWTFENGKPAQRKALRAAFGKGPTPSRGRKAPGKERSRRVVVTDALAAIRDAGGEAATEARIRELSNRALGALQRAKLSKRGEALLSGAARALVERGA